MGFPSAEEGNRGEQMERKKGQNIKVEGDTEGKK
jgi:hypothetical protein